MCDRNPTLLPRPNAVDFFSLGFGAAEAFVAGLSTASVVSTSFVFVDSFFRFFFRGSSALATLGAAGDSALFADATGVTTIGFVTACRSAGLSEPARADTLRFRAERSGVFGAVVEASSVGEASSCVMGWLDAATPAGSLEGNADAVVVDSLADGFSRSF